MTTTQTLCYNCFRQVADPSAPCPHCGFDLGENQQKFPVALRAGTVLNDRYIVGRVLGQGGFGITYVAFDTQLQAKVAVKEYMPSEMATRVEGTTVSVMMDTRAEDFTYGAERFQEEARTLAKFIGHPNIAGVSSYFDQNDTSYFVMDYIEGVSFKSYIANNGGKVSVDETLNVMIPVLRALTAVHAEGFIHRDVTPDNIYISKDGNVKLLDFGSARYSIGDKSKSLDVILKVGYAPKEQYIRRGRQGPYTDVYSCAACFYAALTGYLPPESLERLDQDTLVPVSQVLPEVPEWLDKAILKGLAVQPEGRFQSAAEFLDAIENQLVVDVPAAGQTAPAQPAKKKLNPLMLGGIAAAVVAAVGLGAVLGGRGSGTSTAPGGSGISGGGGDSGGGLAPLIDMLGPKVTIAGREYSAGAEELDLRDAGLSDEDLAVLGDMTSLKKLTLNGDSLTDLSPLAGLTGLTYLNLGEHGRNLEDLSPLAGMTEMEELYLPSDPYYTDLSPLAGMTKLKALSTLGVKYTGSNAIDSLDFLTNMKDLELLNIPVGNVDLAPLAGLTKLREIDLNGELHVKDLSVFQNMAQLETLLLHMSNSDLCTAQDFSSLASLTKLRRVWINLNGLTSLKGLEGMTEITELTINCNDGKYPDLNALSGMKNLRTLTLNFDWGWNGTLDVSALANLEKLQTVNISPGKRVSDPSALAHVPNVTLAT